MNTFCVMFIYFLTPRILAERSEESLGSTMNRRFIDTEINIIAKVTKLNDKYKKESKKLHCFGLEHSFVVADDRFMQ